MSKDVAPLGRRRRRRRLAIAAAVATFTWLVIAVVLLLGAARDLRAGRADATRAADQLGATSLLEGEAVPLLDQAEGHFDAAHDRLRHPVLAPLRILPVVGRQIRSLDAMSGAAATVSKVGADTLERSADLADATTATGPDRLSLIDELQTTVRAARREIDPLDLGPRNALVGPVATARVDLDEKLVRLQTSLRRVDEGLTTIGRLLEGPGNYLLVAANNAEMRAGSGMWLTGAVITTENGRLELGRMRPFYDIADPPDGAVEIDDSDLRAHWAWIHPEREWRNLMPSPRLAPSADLAARMWRAAGQPAVDGVIVVDAPGLAHLVRATGPVDVAGHRLNAEDVEREILHDQYLRFDEGETLERREVLEDVASSVFKALDEGRWEPAVLMAELSAAVEGRHLMAWSPDEEMQRGWTGASMDGALTSDSLLFSLLNIGGNKLDWFVEVDAELTTARDEDGTDVTATFTLANRAPDGEPAYIAGPFAGAGTVEGEYKGVIAVNLPAGARQVRIEGAPSTLSGGDGPTWMIGGELRILRGESRTVSVQFHLPSTSASLVVEPSARVPALRWSHDDQQWTDTERRRISW